MKAFREILAGLGILFAILAAVYGYFVLPQRIPTHFTDNNIVDGWSDKSSLWFPVAIACVVYLAMTLVRFLPQNSFSGPFNEEQRAAAIPIGLDMVAWMNAEMTWIFAGTTWLMVALAQGRSPDLLLWFIFPALGVVFATVIYHVARMVRLGRSNAMKQNDERR
jgi:uncharacterized membrane protein